MAVFDLLDCILYTFMMQWNYNIPIAAMATLAFMLLSSVGLKLLDTVKIDQGVFQDYILDESNHLATQSDGLGVIDIAFQQTCDRPRWILNSHVHPFQATISVIRCADRYSQTTNYSRCN